MQVCKPSPVICSLTGTCQATTCTAAGFASQLLLCGAPGSPAACASLACRPSGAACAPAGSQGCLGTVACVGKGCEAPSGPYVGQPCILYACSGAVVLPAPVEEGYYEEDGQVLDHLGYHIPALPLPGDKAYGRKLLNYGPAGGCTGCGGWTPQPLPKPAARCFAVCSCEEAVVVVAPVKPVKPCAAGACGGLGSAISEAVDQIIDAAWADLPSGGCAGAGGCGY